MNIQRYIDLESTQLSSGSHDSPEAGLCAMELVSWLAGEPHSDKPECVCPVIAAYAIALNDRFSDEDRQLLKPALVACIGTRDKSLEQKRMYLCADHTVRIFAPMALRSAGREEDARKLEACEPVVDQRTATNAAYAAYAANVAAYAAAYAANANAANAAAYAANAAAALDLLWSMIQMSWKDAPAVVRITEELELITA